MASIRQLAPADATAYRAFMLDAYARHPEAFTSTVAEREPLAMDWWTDRISDAPNAPQLVLGAFQNRQLASTDPGSSPGQALRLVGVAGLRRAKRPKTRHKATLFGMAVHPSAQGQGIGRALVEAVLEQTRADPEIGLIQLTVSDTNQRALDLYTACGFDAFGTEPYAIRVGDRFIGKVHMWQRVTRQPDG